jgi:predicted NBD/HSP70 family sugar kinase
MKREGREIYLQQVKMRNLGTILRLVLERGPVSRTELTEYAGLTSGTITNLTQEMLQARVLRERDASPGPVGRHRVNLAFGDALCSLCFDLGRERAGVALADLAGNLLEQEMFLVERSGPEATLALLRAPAERMLNLAKKQGRCVLGVGVSIPGPVDREAGCAADVPNFPGWDRFPLGGVLRESFGLELVCMDDDAHTAALAERWFGLGRNGRDLVAVMLGMGIGGGVIHDGKIRQGAHGLYGQVGRLPVFAAGLHGCWEELAAVPGILRRWGGKGGMQEFFRSVAAGEPRAVECMEETLCITQAAISALFFLYDPELLVLGGRLYPYFSPYRERIAEYVRGQVYPVAARRVDIRQVSFGQRQGFKGAAALVTDYAVNHPAVLLKDA